MRIEQTSEQVGETRWKWAIWLEGSDAELDAVQKVVYHLHPTFANPVVERSQRAANFRLDSSGWGTFVVKLEVHKKDGATEYMRHRLRFSRTEALLELARPPLPEGLGRCVVEVDRATRGRRFGCFDVSPPIGDDGRPKGHRRQGRHRAT